MRSFMFIAANHVWLKLTRSLCSFIMKSLVHIVASPKSKRPPPTLTRVCRLHRRSCSFTQPPFPRKEKHLAVGNGLPRQCSRKGKASCCRHLGMSSIRDSAVGNGANKRVVCYVYGWPSRKTEYTMICSFCCYLL
jgi:hypothetical protein